MLKILKNKLIMEIKRFPISYGIKNIKKNRGMTYVELIVVLSIFAIMSGIVLSNYGTFQAKVDVKILASDIALKIVEAQKDAMSGTMPPISMQQDIDLLNWKPSYGVYFDPSSNDKIFIPFVVIKNLDKYYPDNTPTCTQISQCSCQPSYGCLGVIGTPKNYTIKSIESFYNGISTSIQVPLSITFTRPGSDATFFNKQQNLTEVINFDFVQITVASLQGVKACIQVYPSGRVQIKCK